MIGEYARKSERLVIGLMSGTSADGVDAALIHITGPNESPRVLLLTSLTRLYPTDIRNRLLTVGPGSPVAEVCELNVRIGECFADAALIASKEAGIDPSQIDLIGSHGQTVCHLPDADTRSTLQIGEPSVIAIRTGITTIADFRAADVAGGGQGAPLIPMADFLLLRHETKNRIIQNIGGIANLTYLPAGCGCDDIIAFDTGPGNMLIDGVVYLLTGNAVSYDSEGAMAARGRIDPQLLKELMLHPFLQKNPPRTTGREEFGLDFARKMVARARELCLSDDDCIATATTFSVTSIADAYRRHIPGLPAECDVIAGGGGARNRTLMAHLKAAIAPRRLLLHEDVGISGDAKEAIGFALLAHLTACGLPGNVPRATGARRSVVLGKVAFPGQ